MFSLKNLSMERSILKVVILVLTIHLLFCCQIIIYSMASLILVGIFLPRIFLFAPLTIKLHMLSPISCRITLSHIQIENISWFPSRETCMSKSLYFFRSNVSSLRLWHVTQKLYLCINTNTQWIRGAHSNKSYYKNYCIIETCFINLSKYNP